MSSITSQLDEKSRLGRFLHTIERLGNALPHPAILFLILTFIIILLSWICSLAGLSAIHPVKKDTIQTVNLLSTTGLHLLLTEMVKNFSGFAPLGTVLISMLGFSLAEKSGLMSSLLRILVGKSPRALLTPAILLCGVLSHTAGDIGYILLIPLAAMAFHSVGMNPLAGLAICFAGVSGGFAANILLSTADAMLSSLTQEAARILDPKYVVTPLSNWYFMATSSLLIIGVGTLVANKITIPFFGEYKGDVEAQAPEALTKLERRGLKWAGFVFLALVLFLVAGLVPEDGYLRDPANPPDILHSPALKGVVALIFLFGSLTGLAYGLGAKTIRSQQDVTKAMTESMVTMAPYLVLVFFASQFISFFNTSNIGLILAIHGSDLVGHLGLGPIPLILLFILLTCLLDLVIGGASAKWALMAPMFVPMFMLSGLSPELTQAAYRVGDSVVNIISPLMSYFPLILAFTNKYDPKAKVGTVIAMMIPYSIAFLISWSILLLIWIALGLPVGLGAVLHYQR